MTEQDWLACEDPQAMLEGYFENCMVKALDVSHRKLRLFACACYRGAFKVNGSLFNVGMAVITAAEKWADGYISREQAVATQPPDESTAEGRQEWYLFNADVERTIRGVLALRSNYTQAEKAALLREIVGNPFLPVTVMMTKAEDFARSHGHLAHEWLTPQVLSLAQAAYDERLPDGSLDPFRLLVLADALEEAGCPREALLMHLRGKEWRCWDAIGSVYNHWHDLPGPHVRGCWALDLILGRD